MVFLTPSEFGCGFGGVGRSEATSFPYLVVLGSSPMALATFLTDLRAALRDGGSEAAGPLKPQPHKLHSVRFPASQTKSKDQCRFKGWGIGPTH